MNEWWLYLLDCDGRVYTGISTDPERRLAEHRSSRARGAKFTRGARDIRLAYRVRIGERSLALRAEARLKKLPRARKLHILSTQPDYPMLAELLGLG